MMLFVERSRNKQHHSTERFFRSLSGAETIGSEMLSEAETIGSVESK
jgi:hypothetical protein